jgi:hypothetical protein
MSPDITHLTLQHFCSLPEEQRHTAQYNGFRKVIPYFKHASLKQYCHASKQLRASEKYFRAIINDELLQCGMLTSYVRCYRVSSVA